MALSDKSGHSDSPVRTPRDEAKHGDADHLSSKPTTTDTIRDDNKLEQAWPKYSKHSSDFQGPSQDDSTYLVFWGLQTVLARFFLWVNIPLTWMVGAAFSTGQVDVWLHDFMTWLGAYVSVPSELVVACVFVGGYVTWAFLSHTVCVFGALAHELWWNPYARAPSLKGRVGREEEEAMLLANRRVVRRVWGTFFSSGKKHWTG
ncbi:hypothetical protein Q7P37_001499 [Cladosporium fusiforme]